LCYQLQNTYWEAQNECRRHGMNLVSIDTDEEKDYISGYIQDANDNDGMNFFKSTIFYTTIPTRG
jgi:hypothetical protein